MSEEKITEKVEKYRELTKKALEKVGVIDSEKGEQLLAMARDYFSDAQHFEKEGKNK